MKKIVAAALAALPVLAFGGTALAADMIREAPPVQVQPDQRDGVRIGYLDCRVGGGVGYVIGSAKEADCVFTSTMGGGEPLDHYTGVIRKLGVDLGFTTEGRMIWAVFAPTAGYHHGSLAGLYQGLTAEASFGLGGGLNVMGGGTAGSVQLQLVSLTGLKGLNLAATSTSMTLTPATPAMPAG
ncbi:DUF992 domain-containing protein [Phyllobacterium leguminum]|uniref:Uncharacterized protein DUF992 n=1 Tax=Phyllobacterium leguminum TaxID=314237 RepID=A0A318T7V3_9HYPH|nr:DUF992 domain-containing protein [Phyllobacterium leguminum]PYE86629.1 uncharacterized protein DUF992 [Phyllobacterium leguminum]